MSKNVQRSMPPLVIYTFFIFLCLMPAFVFSQAISPNNAIDALPNFSPDITETDRILPQLPELSERFKKNDTLLAGQRFILKDIALSGNTLFTKAYLQSTFVSYIGTEITLSDLYIIRDKITATYVAQGYINSGAVLPSQTVQNGLVSIQVIEGQLSDINVKTDGRFATEYFAQRVNLAAKPVVNINRLQERLYLFQQDQRIKKISAEFKPGARRGEAILDVDVTENPPSQTNLFWNNYHAPAIGAQGLRFDYQHNNVMANGEKFLLGIEKTEGLNAIDLDYQLPVSAQDNKLNFFASANTSDVVSGDFAALDIESRVENIGLRYQHPIQNKHNKSLDMFVSIEHRKSESLLLGEGFSFSAGPENGLSKLSVLRTGLDWQRRSPQRVFAAYASINIGLDAFDATIHADEADGEFISLLLQSQWAQRVALWNSVVISKVNGQWANEALLGLEQFAVGGHSSVRGYRENSIVRDQGIVASVEWQIPYYKSKTGLSHQTAVFYDVGSAKNIGRETIGVKTLSSIGIGFLGKLHKQINYQLYIAEALKNIEVLGETDLQDDGIHLQMNYQF